LELEIAIKDISSKGISIDPLKNPQSYIKYIQMKMLDADLTDIAFEKKY